MLSDTQRAMLEPLVEACRPKGKTASRRPWALAAYQGAGRTPAGKVATYRLPSSSDATARPELSAEKTGVCTRIRALDPLINSHPLCADLRSPGAGTVPA